MAGVERGERNIGLLGIVRIAHALQVKAVKLVEPISRERHICWFLGLGQVGIRMRSLDFELLCHALAENRFVNGAQHPNVSVDRQQPRPRLPSYTRRQQEKGLLNSNVPRGVRR